MTKETKNTVSAETIVENLKEFANKLHDDSKDGMLHFLLKGDIRKFKLANVFHNISHDLLDILDGKSAKEVLGDGKSAKEVLGDGKDEKDSTVIDLTAVNPKTGDVHFTKEITDTELKEKLLAIFSKFDEELGGN
ncbi:hypothetical protein QM362_07560 [Streptococcus oralis subsp. tigurinus]|uniref:hypothetical protein n=1 Tax=Streptococcus oralis TaxID=1303 RepID=UPI0039C49E26